MWELVERWGRGQRQDGSGMRKLEGVGESSSSARDELRAGLWGEQVRERGQGLGWRMQTCSGGSGICTVRAM